MFRSNLLKALLSQSRTAAKYYIIEIKYSSSTYSLVVSSTNPSSQYIFHLQEK